MKLTLSPDGKTIHSSPSGNRTDHNVKFVKGVVNGWTQRITELEAENKALKGALEDIMDDLDKTGSLSTETFYHALEILHASPAPVESHIAIPDLNVLYQIRMILDPDKPERMMQDELVKAVENQKNELERLTLDRDRYKRLAEQMTEVFERINEDIRIGGRIRLMVDMMLCAARQEGVIE